MLLEPIETGTWNFPNSTFSSGAKEETLGSPKTYRILFNGIWLSMFVREAPVNNTGASEYRQLDEIVN